MHKPSIIDTPSGKYVFVGSVPAELAYVMTDGSPINVQVITEELMLPGSFRKRIRNRVFDTREDAQKAFDALYHS